MSIAARWTPDCQGKQDFDGPIIVVSTRYWPQGGGYLEFERHTRHWRENEDRPEILPSAHCAIIIRDREEDHDLTIAEAEFEAKTEEEVKRRVESWANEKRNRIIRALEKGWDRP